MAKESGDVSHAESRGIRMCVQRVDLEVLRMGDVAAVIKVMPESIETDLMHLKDMLEAVLPENVVLHGYKEEPIAFGLKALMLTLILPDSEGGTESIETAFAEVEGVESVQVVEVGLI